MRQLPVKLTPTLLNVIVGLFVCATNLYHMSRAGAGAAAQSGALIVVGAVSVDPYMFPGILLHIVLDVKVTALVQTLCGSVIQIVKLNAAPLEYTRI